MIRGSTYLTDSIKPDCIFMHVFQPAADAKHYGHFEVYNLLRARGAKVPVLYFNCANGGLISHIRVNLTCACFLLPTRKPKRLQWPCQILKRFQSMNWTHLNLSSEEGRRSQRHVFLLTFSIYSSFCSVLHVLTNFGFWLFIDFW